MLDLLVVVRADLAECERDTLGPRAAMRARRSALNCVESSLLCSQHRGQLPRPGERSSDDDREVGPSGGESVSAPDARRVDGEGRDGHVEVWRVEEEKHSRSGPRGGASVRACRLSARRSGTGHQLAQPLSRLVSAEVAIQLPQHSC